MAYVYGHYKADTGELFYIGKGTGERAWAKDRRNPHWKNVVAKHGFEVRILEDNLTDVEALDKEKQLIEEIGLDNLTNMTEGGQAGGNGLSSEEMSKRLKEHYRNDPEAREKRAKSLKEHYKSNPEGREKHSKRLKEYYRNNSEAREKQSKRMKEVCSTPEAREKKSKVMKERYTNKEAREKHSKAMKEYHANKRKEKGA